jgi:hypothetical protein
MTENSGSSIPVWLVGGVAALLALVLAIFVGLRIVDVFDDTASASLPPFPSFPIETPLVSPTAVPTAVEPTTPPTPTPTPPPTPPPTPTITPEPTSPFGTIRIEGGGALEGDHPVALERSFLQGVSLVTQVVFMLDGNQCTAVIVVDSEAVTGTFEVDSQAKGNLSCLNTDIDYVFFDGTVTLQRGEETLSGEFSIVANNSAGQQATIESEFTDVTIERI